MDTPLWPIIGVSLEIVSTLSGTAGKQLIRLASLWSKKYPSASSLAFSVGMFVNTLCGPILDMTAYSFAAQSLIAPFGGLDVVWNAALAPYILKEKLSWPRLSACALIFTGTILSGVFGPHVDQQYTPEFLRDTLLTYRVMFYLLTLMALIVFNILVPMRRPRGHVMRGASLGITAGMLAGNMWCVKATVELIETSIHDDQPEIWADWMLYAMAAGAAFFALSNIVFMTRGLWEFEALFMVTVYEGTMIVANCASAAIVLLELDSLPTWRIALWATSVLIVIAGMLVICVTEVANGKASVEEEKLASNEPKTPDTECPSTPASEATEEAESCRADARTEDVVITFAEKGTSRVNLLDSGDAEKEQDSNFQEPLHLALAQGTEEPVGPPKRDNSMHSSASASSVVAPEPLGKGRMPLTA